MNIGFPRTRASENAPEPVKLEITVKQKAAGQSDVTEQFKVTEATAKIFYARDENDDEDDDKDDDKCDDKKLKNVCPKRHTGLAVILYELDECDKEYPRGFKTVLIPPTGKYVCDDIYVACLHFVVPAGLDVSGDCRPCGPRRFVARYIANYVDSDFSVCGCVDKD